MTSRREAILEELAHWRVEGLVTEEFYARMRERYSSPASADGLDAPLAPDAPRGAFAAGALHLVGGLLVGAGIVALSFFLDLDGIAASVLFLGVGAALAALGAVLHYRLPDRAGLESALLAAALVPVGAAGVSVDVAWPGFVAAAVAVGVYFMLRGRGPIVVLAGAAYAVATFSATDALWGMGMDQSYTSLPWFVLLLAFGALLLMWRREAWTTVGLGLYVIPLAVSFFGVLQDFNVRDDTAMQVAMGLYFGALLTVGIVLGNRGLVTGAAAGLTIDAVIFATDLGGPGTAVVILLALGGLLVWQAEFLRAYFRGRTP